MGSGTGLTTSTFTYGSDGLRRKMLVQVGNNPASAQFTETTYVLDGQSVVQELVRSKVGSAGSWTATTTVNYLMGPQGPLARTTNTAADAKSRQGWVGVLGHETDPETGYVYMRTRYYDSATGRFASEDPGLQGNNWFAYCGNEPVNHVDQTGRISWEISSAIIAAYWTTFPDELSFIQAAQLPFKSNAQVLEWIKTELDRVLGEETADWRLAVQHRADAEDRRRSDTARAASLALCGKFERRSILRLALAEELIIIIAMIENDSAVEGTGR
jgi:RHS repeat-associated protein